MLKCLGKSFTQKKKKKYLAMKVREESLGSFTVRVPTSRYIYLFSVHILICWPDDSNTKFVSITYFSFSSKAFAVISMSLYTTIPKHGVSTKSMVGS